MEEKPAIGEALEEDDSVTTEDPFDTWCGFIGMIAIVIGIGGMVFVAPGFGYLVLIGLFMFVVTIPFSPKGEDSEVLAFKKQCKDEDVDFMEKQSSKKLGLFLGVSEKENKMLFRVRVHAPIVETVINVADVLQVELAVNGHPTYEAGPVGTLGAAALGGVMFGGAGAIVGSIASIHSGKTRVNSLAIKLRLNDIHQPAVTINILQHSVLKSAEKEFVEMAEMWTNTIEVLRYRLTYEAVDD